MPVHLLVQAPCGFRHGSSFPTDLNVPSRVPFLGLVNRTMRDQSAGSNSGWKSLVGTTTSCTYKPPPMDMRCVSDVSCEIDMPLFIDALTSQKVSIQLANLDSRFYQGAKLRTGRKLLHPTRQAPQVGPVS